MKIKIQTCYRCKAKTKTLVGGLCLSCDHVESEVMEQRAIEAELFTETYGVDHDR